MSLKKKAFSGLFWTFSQQFGTQLINFGISTTLARILLPADFGIIAMFTVVVSIASTIIEGGLASSIVRSDGVDDSDLSTIFWFNIFTAALLYLVVFVVSPFIANFYNAPILKSVIRVYCVILLINSLVSVQNIRLVKQLNFKTIFKIQLPSLLLGGIFGILFAYLGYGVWSLVYSAIIQNMLSALQLWFYSNWRPSLIFSLEKFKRHFSFGYKLTVSDILNTIFNNVYTVIIGKYFSPLQLGYYNRADSLKQLPVSNLSNALNKVTYPLFSEIKNDDVKLKIVYQKVMRLVIFLITPTLCIMIIIARPLVDVLLTDKWLDIVPYFQVLAISGILYPIHSYNLNILKVKGRSDLFLRLEILKKVFIVLILIVSVRYGILGIIWGQVVLSFIAFFVNTYYSGRILKYGSLAQLLDLMPTLLVCLFIFIPIFIITKTYLTDLNNLILIIFDSLLFSGLYLLITYLLKFKELRYIKELIKR